MRQNLTNTKGNKMKRNEAFAEILKFYSVEKLSNQFAHRIERYLNKVEQVKNDPNLVILEEGVDGIRWAHKDSPEGKAHLRKIEQEKAENEAHKEMMENITEYIADEMTVHESVTKVMIRQELDKYGKFSVDNLNEIVELLTAEGVTVK